MKVLLFLINSTLILVIVAYDYYTLASATHSGIAMEEIAENLVLINKQIRILDELKSDSEARSFNLTKFEQANLNTYFLINQSHLRNQITNVDWPNLPALEAKFTTLQQYNHKLKEISTSTSSFEPFQWTPLIDYTSATLQQMQTLYLEANSYLNRHTNEKYKHLLLVNVVLMATLLLLMLSTLKYTSQQDMKRVLSDGNSTATKDSKKAFLSILEDVESEKNAAVALSSALSATQKSLIYEEKRFRAVVENAPFAVVMIDREGKIELVNSAMEKMFGYNKKELVGETIEFLLPENKRQNHPALREKFVENPSPRDMGVGRELYALRKWGDQFEVEIGINPIESDDGLKVIASIVDISQRKQNERTLKQYTKELERSNKALRDFAYVASHDLKAPLRGIFQLSNWIEADVKDKLSDDVKNYFSLLNNRVTRLDKLLDDLLAYSRAGKIHGDFKTINPTEFICDIFELLVPSNHFKIAINCDQPVINTLTIPLDIILRNLFSNSLKHHDKEQGIITVEITSKKAHYQFKVADDGPGIDPRFYTKIFEIFQTLKPRDQVEGSGMGLAIVKKILETYQCYYRLESNSPRGICFIFDWPKENYLREITHDQQY